MVEPNRGTGARGHRSIQPIHIVLILIALAVFFYALIRLLPPGIACDPGLPRHMYTHCTGGKP